MTCSNDQWCHEAIVSLPDAFLARAALCWGWLTQIQISLSKYVQTFLDLKMHRRSFLKSFSTSYIESFGLFKVELPSVFSLKRWTYRFCKSCTQLESIASGPKVWVLNELLHLCSTAISFWYQKLVCWFFVVLKEHGQGLSTMPWW